MLTSWTKLSESQPPTQSELVVKLADGTITGAYVDSYNDILPNGVVSTYEMSSVVFESSVVEWMLLKQN